MDVDEMLEAQLAAEPVGPTKRFSGKGGQMVDVLGLADSEEWLQQIVREDQGIEVILESVECLFASDELVERRHTSMLPMTFAAERGP